MGGDFGPSITLPAVANALLSIPSLRVSLFGRNASYSSSHLQTLESFGERVSFIECSEVVGMDEKPASVLRHKQQSSLYRAIEQVKQGQARACVSAGNTGALMAAGCFLLKTEKDIERPAICAEVPTEKGSCLMLDLGANVSASPNQLLQFAFIGSRLAGLLYKKNRPSVALLNMGEEDIKGNETVKEAAALLQASDLNYAGFVEGHHIYEGRADVIVCDGFTGNAVLKASEGVARLIRHQLKLACRRSVFRSLLALLARPLLKDVGEQMNPSRYNGACLLGLSAVVVKSHGNSDVEGFARAIELAYRQLEAHSNPVPTQ